MNLMYGFCNKKETRDKKLRTEWKQKTKKNKKNQLKQSIFDIYQVKRYFTKEILGSCLIGVNSCSGLTTESE